MRFCVPEKKSRRLTTQKNRSRHHTKLIQSLNQEVTALKKERDKGENAQDQNYRTHSK